jgi:hypothetical protein
MNACRRFPLCGHATLLAFSASASSDERVMREAARHGLGSRAGADEAVLNRRDRKLRMSESLH